MAKYIYKCIRFILVFAFCFYISSSAILAQGLGRSDLFDVEQINRSLNSQRVKNELAVIRQDDVKSGKLYRYSSRLLEKARRLEPKRQLALNEIFHKASVKRPQENGTKAMSKHSRGVMGDVDLGNMSRKSYKKVISTAKEMGYKVDVRGASATIKELNTTLFYRKSGPQIFRRANIVDGEYMLTMEFELAKHMTSAQKKVFGIFDSLKKYEKTLVAPKETLRNNKVIQQMAKSTLRLHETRGAAITPIEKVKSRIEQHHKSGKSGLPSLNHSERLSLLKHGYSPKAAGIVSAKATAEQEIKALQKFQKKCSKVANSSYKYAVKLNGRIEKAYADGIKAAKSSKNVKKAQDYSKKLVKHRACFRKNHFALMKNNGLRTLAKLEGEVVKKSATLKSAVERKVLRNDLIKKSVTRQNRAANFAHRKTVGNLVGEIRNDLKHHNKAKVKAARTSAIANGVFIHLGISAASSIISRVKDGCSVGETISGTFKDMTRAEFLLGDVMGGTIGAVAGAMIPLPAALSSMGFAGRALGAMPAIGLAMIGAQLGHTAITLLKSGNFSMANLFASLDVPSILGQTIGAAIGVAAAAAILPGTIGAIIGGMAGGYLGMKLLQSFFPKDNVMSELEEVAPKASVAQIESAPTEVAERAVEVDLPQLTIEVRKSYEEFMNASRSGDPRAMELLHKYKELRSELEIAQREYAANI